MSSPTIEEQIVNEVARGGTPYARNDDSAWCGDGDLAFIAGVISGILTRSEFRDVWSPEMPRGYAPVLDLVMKRSGKRFRLRIGEVT